MCFQALMTMMVKALHRDLFLADDAVVSTCATGLFELVVCNGASSDPLQPVLNMASEGGRECSPRWTFFVVLSCRVWVSNVFVALFTSRTRCIEEAC
mmetsp:Transcript_13965/g.38112  ORF Transcript_13965/g.38112 Transcript_13965/m.38112 type:complete len:97 (-) Transcript_13965:53-343(-)